jgi:hypothetical protein
MCINGLTVIFSSHKGKEYDEMFKERIRSTSGLGPNNYPLDIICVENHGEFSLTEAYNKGFDIYRDSKGCENKLVFCHNDIHFRTPKWGVKILEMLNKNEYGVIGLAGTIELADNGIWWNDRTKCFGIVDHTDGYKEWTTHFAPPIKGIKQVAAIDGVFIAVNPKKAVFRFREEFKNFHFYDISFCADNFLKGVKIGVTTDIRIMHESPGMVNQKWEDNRKQFVETYGEHLPMKI